jgi:septal ring factor EnvC (AmiA/AmiB activator)
MCVAASRASTHEKELRETRKKIQTEEKTIKKLRAKGRDLLKSIEDVDKDIVVAKRRRNVSEAKMAKLKKAKQESEADLTALEREIERQSKEQGRRLVGYYRLGRTGMIPLIFSDASPPEKFRNLDSLKRILVSDWDRLQAFHELLTEKERVEAGLRERLEAEKAHQETLQKRKEALEVKRQEKNALLFRIEQDKNLHERLLKELEEAEKALLKKMREEPPPPVLVDRGPFSSLKGKLGWPVKGKVYRRFGPGRAVRSRGIDIKTEPGAPVWAVCGGSVAYADWFRGYGKLLIIHHGQKDYTVSAHLSELTKRKGERVETGEIVGRAGETGSVVGCLVHFEIWHSGRPEDPLKWLHRGGSRR